MTGLLIHQQLQRVSQSGLQTLSRQPQSFHGSALRDILQSLPQPQYRQSAGELKPKTLQQQARLISLPRQTTKSAAHQYSEFRQNTRLSILIFHKTTLLTSCQKRHFRRVYKLCHNDYSKIIFQLLNGTDSIPIRTSQLAVRLMLICLAQPERLKGRQALLISPVPQTSNFPLF